MPDKYNTFSEPTTAIYDLCVKSKKKTKIYINF